MRTTRGILASALALMAVVLLPAAASASAGLSATEYSATLSGDDIGSIYVGIGSELESCSGLKFSGTLKEQSKSATTSSVVDPTCGTFASLAFKGCQLKLDPAGYQTLGVSPSGCGPVNVTFAPCAGTFAIEGGTNIAASYQTVGTGSSAHVVVSFDDSSVDYVSLNNNLCAAKGEHKSNLHLKGEIDITAKNSKQETIGLKTVSGGVYVGGGKEGKIEADDYPAVVSGDLLNLGPYHGKAKVLSYPGEGEDIDCGAVHYSATAELTAPAKSFSLNASYSKCEWPGLGEVGVSMNSCHYTFSSLSEAGSKDEYQGAASIACNTGDKIVLTGPGCTVTIGAQSLSKGGSFVNWDVGTEASLLGSTRGEKLKFSSEGAFCFIEGLGDGVSYENGSLESDMLLQADFPG